jgi:DNA-binding NarL/FixJ family response regulator
VTSIRVLIVDDHELVRRHICTVLGTEPDVEVVGQAGSGIEAVHQAAEHQPDVVLVEILVVTSHHSMYFVRAAFNAGARGFLSKSDIYPELVFAVRQVHAKHRFVGKNSGAAAAGLVAGEATG